MVQVSLLYRQNNGLISTCAIGVAFNGHTCFNALLLSDSSLPASTLRESVQGVDIGLEV